jgi:hypothetical protein
MKHVAILFIRGYQLVVSPLLPPNTCRFTPTCSQYAIDAVEKYGFRKGVWCAVKRIGRCHPFHPGGYDPA